MTIALALFLGLTITLTAVVAVYLGSVLWVFRRPPAVGRLHPAWSLIPVVTPLSTWRAGSRSLAIVLVGLVVLYAGLQLYVHAR